MCCVPYSKIIHCVYKKTEILNIVNYVSAYAIHKLFKSKYSIDTETYNLYTQYLLQNVKQFELFGG